MTIMKIRGIELDVEFQGSMQGFRMNACELDGENWQDIEGFTFDIQRIGETQFEALSDLANKLFDDVAKAETMAEILGVPMRFADDVDCRDCDYFGHYEEMQEVNDEYLCLDCAEKEEINATATN